MAVRRGELGGSHLGRESSSPDRSAARSKLSPSTVHLVELGTVAAELLERGLGATACGAAASVEGDAGDWRRIRHRGRSLEEDAGELGAAVRVEGDVGRW
ncbi:hypothetical protein BE11_47630 [Sorangium cellulosum]|nr:hypothetical protein BE11_47630 [Sorangium cellulosum]